MAGSPVINEQQRTAFLKRLGQDIRKLREDAQVSQAMIAELFGWHRTAVSKIEQGERNLGIYEYLLIMNFLRDMEPAHPAVALLQRLLPRDRQAPKKH